MTPHSHRPDPFLARLADALRPLDDAAAIQTVSTRMLGEHLGAGRALYAESAEDGTTVRVCAEYRRDDTTGHPTRFQLGDLGPLAPETLAAGLTLVRKDGRAQVTVPLVRDGRLCALLSVPDPAARPWTEDEVALVEESAEQTWAALARARADEAVRESEAKYRSLFNSIDEGFCVVQILLDDEGNPHDYRFLEANRVFERQTGLSSAIGRTARELVPNLEPHWFEIYGRVGLTGDPVRFVQGSEAMGRWFDVYAFRVGRPELLRVAILFTDITQRRRAEAERDQLAAQRQLALNAARLGWWHYDPVNRVAWWDARYREIFGIADERNDIGVVMERLHPDDAPSVWAAVEAALDPDDPVPYSVQYRIRRPDGQIRWVEAHGLATFEETEGTRRATGLLGTVADITDRKAAEDALRESEQRFRNLADTAPAVLWVTEPDGYCSFLSRGWYAMTGQTERKRSASGGSTRFIRTTGARPATPTWRPTSGASRSHSTIACARPTGPTAGRWTPAGRASARRAGSSASSDR